MAGKKTQAPSSAKPEAFKERLRLFFHYLSCTGNISDSYLRARISAETIYRLKQDDEKFRKALDIAMEMAIDRMEDEVARRSLAGVADKYSHVLLMFRLKAERMKYRDQPNAVNVCIGDGVIQQAKALRDARRASPAVAVDAVPGQPQLEGPQEGPPVVVESGGEVFELGEVQETVLPVDVVGSLYELNGVGDGLRPSQRDAC